MLYWIHNRIIYYYVWLSLVLQFFKFFLKDFLQFLTLSNHEFRIIMIFLSIVFRLDKFDEKVFAFWRRWNERRNWNKIGSKLTTNWSTGAEIHKSFCNGARWFLKQTAYKCFRPFFFFKKRKKEIFNSLLCMA